MKGSRLMLTAVAVLAATLWLGGCAKKVAKAPAPPPPAPPAPTVALSVSRDTIQQGQSTTLTWTTQNANDITISGLGAVPASGSRMVTPPESTTYALLAKGPGGERDTSARVTVEKPVAQAPASPSLEELVARNVKDVFFDYDKYVIRPDQTPVTQADAKFLLAHPDVPILVAGHCDDRGSEEYNLALGNNRANAVKEQLVRLGVNADRIKTISYGKEKPFCTVDNDQCWQQNRRGHFTAQAHN